MSFDGRDELVNNFIGYFEKYSKIFLDNTKTYYKNQNQIISDEISNIYEELYCMLLARDFDEDCGKQLVKHNGFDKACFFQMLLILQFDFANTLKKNNEDYKFLFYLINAVERYNNIFDKIYINAKKENAINVFAAGGISGFFIHENFIDTFKKMAQADEKVEFLNLYYGVPVRTFGEILQVEDDSILVKVDLLQILAMKEEDCAYIIQNQYIQKNMKANIVSVNIHNCTVVLNKFETQAYMHALKRQYPRVHPNEFTRIVLEHEDGRIANGKLFDISEGGIGVVSNEDVGFKSGDILSSHISLRMPKSNETVDLNLKFKLVVLIVYQNAYRYCLQLLPNQEDAKKIQEFAIARVDETLVELKNQLSLYKRD